jgi:elongator complex protein 2
LPDHDAQYLATVSQDKTVRVWRINTSFDLSAQQPPDDGTFKQKQVTFPASSLLAGSNDRSSPITVAVSLESVLAGHEGWVYGVRWARASMSDKLILLTASVDKTLVVWEEDADAGLWLESARVGDVGGNHVGFLGCLVSPGCQRILGYTRHGAFQLWEREVSR